MKSQINIRASELLQRQLAELTDKLGTSITETVSLAIDRTYQQEINMNIERNYRPHSEYKGYAIETATGIGGHFARTTIEIDADTSALLEVGPNDTEQGALQSMRRTIQDALYAHGYAEEPAPHFPQ